MQALRYSRRKSFGGTPCTPQRNKLKLNVKSLEWTPRILVIGAGYRGHAYANPIHASGEAIIAAVAEPSAFKRQAFGEKFIWGRDGPQEGQAFSTWEEYISYEIDRRERLSVAGGDGPRDRRGVCMPARRASCDGGPSSGSAGAPYPVREATGNAAE